MSPRQYPAILHKDAASDYGVSFPDFPGCVSAGRTPEEALGNAAQALALHVGGMREDGEEFPDATPLERAKAKAEPKGFLAVALVAVMLPARSQRYNVMLPEDLVSRVDALTGNRSAFIADALRDKLDGTRARAGARSTAQKKAGLRRPAKTGKLEPRPARS